MEIVNIKLPDLKPYENNPRKNDQAVDAKIEYFECETQSEVEAFEAHLIELYETWKYYNKVKAHWGINRFLPDVEKWWKVFSSSPFADTETENFVMNIRILIRAGEIEKAKELLNMIDFIYD